MDDGIKLNEGIKVKGHVKLIVRDAETGEIKPELCQEFDNVITTLGLELIADALRGDDYVTYCGVGSGSTAVAVGDIALETEIGSHKAITDHASTGGNCIFATYYGTTDNNGTWRESGLFNSSSGGTMLCHALFGTPFTKSNSWTAAIEWTITFS